MKITSFLLAAISAIVLCAGVVNATKPYRGELDWQFQQTTQEFELGAFDSISVSGVVDVTFRQSDSYRVVVRAYESLFGSLELGIQDGTLSLIAHNDSEPAIELYVYAPSLAAATLSGAVSAFGWDTISGDRFRLSVSGMAEAEIDFDVRNLAVDASDMANLSLLGTAQFFIARMSGMTNLDASDLVATNIIVNASYMANVVVYVSYRLRSSSHGMAQVHVLGL